MVSIGVMLLIEIVEINRKLGNGCTVPYVVWCNDGRKYVVKFPGNPNGSKALINELIASRLCEYLNLPIMEYQLIAVKRDNYRESIDSDIEPIEGTAFGTVYNDYLLTVLNSGEIRRASNSYDAIKILVFDLLIGNYDRNKGNLMINPQTKKVIMIDHTHIFNLGVIWDSCQLKRLEQESFDVTKLHPFNYNNIINALVRNDQFYFELNNFVDRVKNIDRGFVKEILDGIPRDWDISNQEKIAITDFIVNRFKRVDEILELLNIKGGDSNET